MFSILAIPWPADKEVVSRTVKAWKTGRHFDLDGTRAFAKRQVARMLKMFLSHRTGTQNSLSLNHKPVPWGSKIVGKTEWEKKGESSNHDWLVIIFYCIRYMNIHFHLCFSSLQTETITRAWSFAAVDFYWQFSFHHAIQFHPTEHISTRSMPHSKWLAKVEAISFPTSKHIFSVNCTELNSPTS